MDRGEIMKAYLDLQDAKKKWEDIKKKLIQSGGNEDFIKVTVKSFSNWTDESVLKEFLNNNGYHESDFMKVVNPTELKRLMLDEHYKQLDVFKVMRTIERIQRKK